jgi:hypothetical protein
MMIKARAAKWCPPCITNHFNTNFNILIFVLTATFEATFSNIRPFAKTVSD